MRFRAFLTASAICGGLAFLAGCPSTNLGSTGDTGTDGDTSGIDSLSDLTVEEQQAIAAALSSAGRLNETTNMLQSTAGGADSGQSALGEQPISFGECPKVTLSGTDQGSQLEIDFMEGCTFENLGATCSGALTGTLNASSSMIDASFDGLTCNDRSLDGEVAVAIDAADGVVTLEGDWNLLFEDGQSIQTNGEGTTIYDSNTQETQIPTFTGSLVVDVDSYGATFDDLQISYAAFGNFVPFAGEATLVGERTLVVQFNEDSPVNQTVDISVDGSPFFTIDLNDL